MYKLMNIFFNNIFYKVGLNMNENIYKIIIRIYSSYLLFGQVQHRSSL